MGYTVAVAGGIFACPSCTPKYIQVASREEPELIVEPWVSVEDVAKHLGVAKDSVYRWIENKSLPAHKMGRLWKFQISEVDAWVRAGGADTPDNNRRNP